jgi:hypothetical protein
MSCAVLRRTAARYECLLALTNAVAVVVDLKVHAQAGRCGAADRRNMMSLFREEGAAAQNTTPERWREGAVGATWALGIALILWEIR